MRGAFKFFGCGAVVKFMRADAARSWEEAMITFIRQAHSVAGKLGEAMAFAHEITTLSSRIIGTR